MNALLGRVGKCVPPHSTDSIKNLLSPLAQSLARTVGKHSAIPYIAVYRNMPAKKRARYARAEENIRQQGGRVTKRQSRIKMFVKIEGVKFNSSKKNPDCRAIQFRSYEFTLQLAAHIKISEHKLYNLTDVPGFGPGRLFAKNMNPSQRGRALWEKFNWIPGCRILELDASRFDAHVNADLLKYVEHLYWSQTCLGEQIRELLSWQLLNRGSFTSGEFTQKYEVKGGRMSGDANTAAGNCIIMACMLAAFGQSLSGQFTFLCDGDDSVFFYNGPEVEDEHVTNFFRQFGMSMKIEAKPRYFEDINFCQAKPVLIEGEWNMIRNPFKILSKLGVSPKLSNPRARAKYIRTIALGELSLSKGCPVVQPFLEHVIDRCTRSLSARQKKRGMLHTTALNDYWRLSHLTPSDWTEGNTLPITTPARKSFERAWGVGIDEQLSFEETLEKWTLDLARTEVVPGPQVETWLWHWRIPEEYTMGSHG